LGHQPIQSLNTVGAPADLIFQRGWVTSRFNLSTRLGDQPIQSLNREGLFFSKPMDQRCRRNDELFVFTHDFQVDARILALHHHDAVQVLHLEI